MPTAAGRRGGGRRRLRARLNRQMGERVDRDEYTAAEAGRLNVRKFARPQIAPDRCDRQAGPLAKLFW